MTEPDRPRRDRQMSVGIAILDHAGRIIRANKTLEFLVQRAEPLEGTAAEDLFATPPQGHGAAAIRATLTDRKPRLFTTRTAEPLIIVVRFVPRLAPGKRTRFLVHAEAAGARSSASTHTRRDTVPPSDGRLATVVHD
ncbi:MAG: PAS domain-containing protein, partial [Acetobacteraceae bacterium]|nr:PAS domain-containing protein [Acetobacteraceae bacterium]